MAGRDKRAVSQPMNYKKFNEQGLNMEEGAEVDASPMAGDNSNLEIGHPSPENATSSQATAPYADTVELQIPKEDDDLDADQVIQPNTKTKIKNVSGSRNKQHGSAQPKPAKQTVKDYALPPPVKDINLNELTNVNLQVDAAMSKKEKITAKNLVEHLQKEANQHQCVRSVVQKPVAQDRYDTIFVDSSDSEPELLRKYRSQLQQQAMVKDLGLRWRSHSLEETRYLQGKVKTWLDRQSGDDMNKYLSDNKKKLSVPHHNILIPREGRTAQARKQQQLLEELANSDDLEFCRDTGMAKRKKRDKRSPTPSSHHHESRSSRSSPSSRHSKREHWHRHQCNMQARPKSPQKRIGYE